MKTAIVYKSFLGTTKQYAGWLHESLESSLFKSSQVSAGKLRQYDLVILCSATYMGSIIIRGYLSRIWEVLQGTKVVLLVVGMLPQEDAQSVTAYERIPEHIRQNVQYFKLPGKVFSAGADKVKRENLQPVLDYVSSLSA